ncbi:hypothetical protein D0Z00_000654 [Geotrichum galactomycetum]|uniref:Uncharacterized protein n=1 Tax=Geotrichum galactomycetum TaxID=27317 RepID=A0ACB6V9F9_9ASCO|nr:hypothetical protein D0Z00_000654 [Geotrichum candidum]
MPSSSTIITSAVAVSAISYLVYFDYKRRNDAEFRRSLRKAERNFNKQRESAATAELAERKTKIQLALKNSLLNDPLPVSAAEREQFFVAEISRADELINISTATGSEDGYIQAALAFYRALSVYPNPIDLLSIYDKSIKQPVLDIFRTMVLLEPPEAIKSSFESSALAGGLGGGAAAAAAVEANDFSVE